MGRPHFLVIDPKLKVRASKVLVVVAAHFGTAFQRLLLTKLDDEDSRAGLSFTDEGTCECLLGCPSVLFEDLTRDRHEQHRPERSIF